MRARSGSAGRSQGTVTLTGGLGGMGGAQPLAVTMNGGVALCVDVDPARIERRIKTRYLDRETDDLDDARSRGSTRRRPSGEAVSIGLLGNCAEVLPELLAARVRGPTSSPTRRARTIRSAGTCPAGLSLRGRGARCATPTPTSTQRRAYASMAEHVRRDGRASWTRARSCSTTATTCGRARSSAGLPHDRAYAYPGFVPAFVRPLFCEGKGPFRWAALSGDPEDIVETDRAVAELFPDDERLQRWLAMAEERVAFQGLPARICWLGLRRTREGRARASTRWSRRASCPRRS